MMHKHNPNDLTGHPSDYGSRTLTDEERQRNERGEIGRTADGEPAVERGTADSAISRDAGARSDDMQGDTDFERTNAEGERLTDS